MMPNSSVSLVSLTSVYFQRGIPFKYGYWVWFLLVFYHTIMFKILAVGNLPFTS